MRAEGLTKLSASLLLLISVAPNLTLINGVVAIDRNEVKEYVIETLHQEYLLRRNLVRRFGFEVLGHNVPEEKFENGPGKNAAKNGRKKRKNRRRKRRRRRRRFRRNRGKEQPQLRRNLQSKNVTKVGRRGSVWAMREMTSYRKGENSIRKGIGGVTPHDGFNHTRVARKELGQEVGCSQAKHSRLHSQTTVHSDESTIDKQKQGCHAIPNGIATVPNQRRRNQGGNIEEFEFVDSIGVIFSALSPFFFSGNDLNLWAVGVNESTFDGNIFSQQKPPDLYLLNFFDTSTEYLLWEFNRTADGNNLGGNAPVQPHLTFLNNDTLGDGERVDEYNIYMAVEEVDKNEDLFAERMNAFSMGPFEPDRWVFFPGPVGDRTFRPFPQNAFGEQFCASAQMQDHIGVTEGSKIKLKKCEDKGLGRMRQTWVYCGESFGCGFVSVTQPLFQIQIFLSNDADDVVRRQLEGRANTNVDIRFLTDAATCSNEEDMLDEQRNILRWLAEFNLGDLVGVNTTETTRANVDILITSNCEGQATTYGLDTLFRFYENVGNTQRYNCPDSAIISCSGGGTNSVLWTNVGISVDNTYYFTAAGANQAQDCKNTGTQCLI